MSEDAKSTVRDIGELALVARILAALRVSDTPAGLPETAEIGPGDDAAVLRCAGDVVLSTDSQHEGVHFRRDWIEPLALGMRAIAINASDIGAMGGRPRAFLVAVALPPDTMLEWAERLAQGLRVGAERYGASIVGGDVACVPERIAVNVTAIGELDAGVHPVRRDGARPSNRCFVTGNPGRAAAGRDLLEAGYRLADGAVQTPRPPGGDLPPEVAAAVSACIGAYIDPDPPTGFGLAAARAGVVNAMIDVSDGAGMDLGRICKASAAGVVLDGETLCSDAVLRSIADLTGGDIEAWALRGGEDYQLLCAVAAAAESEFLSLAAVAGVNVRAIGDFTEDDTGLQVRRDGVCRPFDPAGWDHFS